MFDAVCKTALAIMEYICETKAFTPWYKVEISVK